MSGRERVVDLVEMNYAPRKPRVGDTLPNPEKVEIKESKFAGYSMKADHPGNQGKYRAWEALGYEISTPSARERSGRDAIGRLRDGLPDSLVVKEHQIPNRKDADGKMIRGGHRATTRTPFVGPNGREATMVTSWHRDYGREHYRLLTPGLSYTKRGAIDEGI